MTEEQLRALGRSLFDRGITAGSSGNISVKHDDFYLMTPTNSCLGFLDPARLAKLTLSGGLISGDPPTKELPST
jgi:3-dehydro-4-phosphotetronate decarboxylase